MTQHYPILIVLLPLLAALIITIIMWRDKRYCFALATVALAGATLSSIMLAIRVVQDGEILYKLAGWEAPIGISYRIDTLNGLVLPIVALVALLNLITNRRVILQEFQEKTGTFTALYLLFVTGLLGIVATGDVFNLYVLLEICSLTGYALIGLGQDRAPLSALNYLFLGTIGASLYLLGVGYLYVMTGSLNMVDLARILPQFYQSSTVFFAFLFCLIGLFIKMAFFPMHGWLPNAYCHAPSASTSLMAPLMTKVMIYVMIRICLTVFSAEYIFKVVDLERVLVCLASLAIIAGSLIALSQRSLRRMLSYLIITEVGYMVGGFWLGNAAGMTGAVLHIINDAFMTLCVFLVLALIESRLNDDTIENLKGLFTKMPFTMAACVVGGLSLIGVPPTCGFFSKWYLLLGGLDAGHYDFVAALLFSSLINVILFFRIFEIGYFKPGVGPDREDQPPTPILHYAEAPLEMVLPVLIVAAGLIVLGFLSGSIITTFINPIIPHGLG
ncbi:monovalent cation/H+ antiporter subunit D family protein [bacterium]|nr:monovalent cation/H+ antiporter subunit D family protein [bacterium]